MKKKLLGLTLLALSLVTVLAACRISVDVVTPPSNLQVTTGWEVQGSSPTKYVICENFATQINTSFRLNNASERLNRVEVFLRGVNDPSTSTSRTFTSREVEFDNNTVSFDMNFAPYGTPLSVLDSSDISTQAILVVPTDPAMRSGFVDLTYHVYADGNTEPFVMNYPTDLEVWGGCTRP